MARRFCDSAPAAVVMRSSGSVATVIVDTVIAVGRVRPQLCGNSVAKPTAAISRAQRDEPIIVTVSEPTANDAATAG